MASPCHVCDECIKYCLNAPRIIAEAHADLIGTGPTKTDTQNGVSYNIPFGQDLTQGTDGASRQPHNVGSTEGALKLEMINLLIIFGKGGFSGMARALFARFMAPQTSHHYWSHTDLDSAADTHENIEYFCNAALNHDGASSKTRIHQALRAAGWDINAATAPTDLGPPAFNTGGDNLSGLKIMINGIQHVYVIVTAYEYDDCEKTYDITLKYWMYDVFGLDDPDVVEFGAEDNWLSTPNGRGFTAWWQLQHQFNYYPLITRWSVERTFTGIPAV